MNSTYQHGSNSMPPGRPVPLSLPLRGTSQINIHFTLPPGAAPTQPQPPPVPPQNLVHVEPTIPTYSSIPAQLSEPSSPPPPPVPPPPPPPPLSGENPTSWTTAASVDSEADSARGSLPDDNISENSNSSSRGGDSLADELRQTLIRTQQRHTEGTEQDDDQDSQAAEDNFWDDAASDSSSVGFGADLDDEQSTWDKNVGTVRVALLKDDEAYILLMVCCDGEAVADSDDVRRLMRQLAERCAEVMVSKRMKKDMVKLSPAKLQNMKMSDGRAAREHLAELSGRLGGELAACEAFCRRYTPDDPWPEERAFIGAEVHSVVHRESRFEIGKSGVMVVLNKKSKYAVAREFSESLCKHIAELKPTSLGKTPKLQSRGPASHVDASKKPTRRAAREAAKVKELMVQQFWADPTINVAEAARRSFVDVLDFALFE